MTEWCSPDRPPEVEEGFEFLSDNVLLKLRNGREVVGFYDFYLDVWYVMPYGKGPTKLKPGTVLGWRPLE